MSKAKYPNRDALRQANDIYLDAIYPFVIRCLDKVKGATAEELIKNALRLAPDDDIEEKVEISDIAHLVRTYWYDFFEGHFDAVDRHYEARSAIGLIVEGRNRASHRPWDLDPEFTRTQLFLIAEVLGKINMSDAQREVEVIREELFNDTTGQLVTIAVEDEKAKYEKSISELEKCLTAEKEKNKKLSKEVDDNAAELDIKKEELEKRSGQLVSMRLSQKKNKKQFNSISEKLKKLQEAHNTCDERLTAISDQLTSTEAERDDYKGRFETASEQLDEVNERLSLTSDQFLAVKAERDTSTEHLTVIQKLLTASTISDQSVYPPLKTDSAVRILDRRGTDKRSYLLELLEQEQTAIIYVQSEERIDQLLTLVGPEKADVIGACNERTSETEEAEVFGKLEKGELIAVVSNTAFSTLASLHCVEHFVFCHLTPGLDEFFRQCELAFTSEKNAYLHLIYDSEQDVKGLNQKYPDRKTLEKFYSELRKLAETNGDLIRPESVYNELGLAKPGIETGLAIFEELQLLERSNEGVKLLPPAGKKLDESSIYCRGEELKKRTEDFRDFQLGQPIEQIGEEILGKLSVGSEQVLREVSTDEMYSGVSEMENDLQPIETVENDSEADDGDTETGQAPKPECPNAKATVEQVREIRSRSTAGELNSELAEEDSEKKPEVKQSEFWQPIRAGEFGELFTGKPVPISNEGWITKTIRNIGVCLYLTNQRCYVQIYFHGANGSERREKIMTLFPKSEYTYAYRDSPRETKVQFPVLDKGRKDQDDWDEIREKLVAMGTDIYNKIDASDL